MPQKLKCPYYWHHGKSYIAETTFACNFQIKKKQLPLAFNFGVLHTFYAGSFSYQEIYHNYGRQITMDRVSMCNRTGNEYKTSNIEGGEYSYAQAAGSKEKPVQAIGYQTYLH